MTFRHRVIETKTEPYKGYVIVLIRQEGIANDEDGEGDYISYDLWEWVIVDFDMAEVVADAGGYNPDEMQDALTDAKVEIDGYLGRKDGFE